jgi:4-carboxymuconolactone decarboxylase
MSRLPYLTRDDLDDEGAALFDAMVANRGDAIRNDEGGLIGPFNAWVHAPALGTHLVELGTALRFSMSIDRRLIELAIITTGAHWRAEFEWWAHARMAREHGVSDAVIDAIADGAAPPFTDEGERVVHGFAAELATTGRVADATYARARDLLGDRGVVELVTLCGFYALVSYTLNAHDVPLPAGVSPRWERS